MKKRLGKKQKIPIPDWLMEVFVEQGIDTSGYETDRHRLMEISQPYIDYPRLAPEPAARSPSASMLDPPTPEPELAEKDSDLSIVETVESVTIPTVFAMFTNGFRIPVKNINSGLDPPKRLQFHTSGADPPRNGEVRIRSPAA